MLPEQLFWSQYCTLLQSLAQTQIEQDSQADQTMEWVDPCKRVNQFFSYHGKSVEVRFWLAADHRAKPATGLQL